MQEIQGFQVGHQLQFPQCVAEVTSLLLLRSTCWCWCEQEHHSSLYSPARTPSIAVAMVAILNALPGPAFNMLVFSPQLLTCCTGVTSSRQGSCLAASCCCCSPWPSSASSASWPTWPLLASRPPLASESTNRSYRLCRRRTRATPSSECFAVMARGHLSCKGSIPSGNSRFFSCCFYTG